MEMKLDVATLVGSLMWPAVAVFVIIKFGQSIAEFCTNVILPRLKKVSLGGFSVELGEGTELRLADDPSLLSVLQGGSAAMVNDSTVRTFTMQVLAPGRADYAVLDLGEGRAWLTSRLYILAVVLRRMRAIQAFVFVQSSANLPAKFVGVGDTGSIRWALAERYPMYEYALAEAERDIWGFANRLPPGAPPGASGRARVVNLQGRLETADDVGEHPAVVLVREFLRRIQTDTPPLSEASWQRLGSSNITQEYAEWVSAGWVEQMLAGSLSTVAISKKATSDEADAELTRRLTEAPSKWTAIVGPNEKFEQLVDTDRIAKQIAQKCFAQAP